MRPQHLLHGTTPAQTVNKLVPYALKTWGKKVYIVAADYNYGQITAKWMTEVRAGQWRQRASGGLLPARRDQLLRYHWQDPAGRSRRAAVGSRRLHHTAFYRQWAASGMKSKIPSASTTFGLVGEMSTLNPLKSDGIVTAYGYYQELQTPKSVAFVKALRDKFGADLPYVSELAAATYEGFWLWVEGVKKAGSLDRMKVIEALDTGLSFDGPDRQGHARPRDPARHAQRLSRPGRKQDVEGARVLPRPGPVGHRRSVQPHQGSRNTNKQYVIDVKT